MLRMIVLKNILLVCIFIIGYYVDLAVPEVNSLNGILPLQCQPETFPLDTILPAANIDYSSLTLSGFSSGAVMSIQYHFAHSTEVKGVGIFAGIPYSSYYEHFLNSSPGIGPDILNATENSVLENNVKSFVKSGLIDDTENLKGSNVYVFHGTKDTTVNPLFGERLVEMYKDYGAVVKANMDMAATHTVPTDNFPFSRFNCDDIFDSTLSGGISNCGYEGVFDMFSHLYGKNYKAPMSSSIPLTGNFSALFQGPYTLSGNADTDFMDSKGFLYVPNYCQDPEHTCKIHIALHGCFQNIYNE